MSDVKRRGGMFGVVTKIPLLNNCDCVQMVPEIFLYLPYLDSNDAPKTTDRKSVVIFLFLERHYCQGMETKGKSVASSARSHDLEHSTSTFDFTHLRCSYSC